MSFFFVSVRTAIPTYSRVISPITYYFFGRPCIFHVYMLKFLIFYKIFCIIKTVPSYPFRLFVSENIQRVETFECVYLTTFPLCCLFLLCGIIYESNHYNPIRSLCWLGIFNDMSRHNSYFF